MNVTMALRKIKKLSDELTETHSKILHSAYREKDNNELLTPDEYYDREQQIKQQIIALKSKVYNANANTRIEIKTATETPELTITVSLYELTKMIDAVRSQIQTLRAMINNYNSIEAKYATKGNSWQPQTETILLERKYKHKLIVYQNELLLAQSYLDYLEETLQNTNYGTKI